MAVKMIVQSIKDEVLHSIGYPSNVKRWILAHPEARVEIEAPSASISLDSVVRWDLLGHDHSPSFASRKRPGELSRWVKGQYGEQVFLPEYEHLATEKQIDNWNFDIQQVFGFSSSKSTLSNFSNTHTLAEQNSPEMIRDVTEEGLAKNLSHPEIRILHSPSTSDHLAYHLWDGRTFLCNNGGSHHFAAAKYIAYKLGKKVPISGKLYVREINGDAIDALRNQFEIFAVSDEPAISNSFLEAMMAYGATWLTHNLPSQYSDYRAILLPKNEARSMKVASLLHQWGFFNLGKHLSLLCDYQKKNGRELGLVG